MCTLVMYQILQTQLPKELRLPNDHEDLSLSSDLTRQFVAIYYSSLLLQAQNSSFTLIVSYTVLLPSADCASTQTD